MRRKALAVGGLIMFFCLVYLVEKFSLLYLGWGSVAGFFLAGYLSVIIVTSRYHGFNLKISVVKYLNVVLIGASVMNNYQCKGWFGINDNIVLIAVFLIQSGVYLAAWYWAESLVAVPCQTLSNKAIL